MEIAPEAMSSVVQQSLIVREDFEQQHEQTVREEIERFRAKAEQVLAGTVTEDEFRSFRLRYGIYGQRQPGVQMVRTKFPSGMVTSAQLERLAEVADEFGGGRGHLTTRQNLQYHRAAGASGGPDAQTRRRGTHYARSLFQYRAECDSVPAGGSLAR